MALRTLDVDIQEIFKDPEALLQDVAKRFGLTWRTGIKLKNVKLYELMESRWVKYQWKLTLDYLVPEKADSVGHTHRRRELIYDGQVLLASFYEDNCVPYRGDRDTLTDKPVKKETALFQTDPLAVALFAAIKDKAPC